MDTLVAVIVAFVLGTMIGRFVRNPDRSPRARFIVKMLALYIGAATLAVLIASMRF